MAKKIKKEKISSKDWDGIQQEALKLFQRFLRIDTQNPPGNEKECAEAIAEVLRSEKIEPEVLTVEKKRANIVARLKSDGSGGPLLLAGHLDVVPAEEKRWTYPPFSGEVKEGFIWGRGAIDMKNTVTYNLMSMLLLKRLGVRLKRDVIFLGVADEERGCQKGSRWMVDNCPEKIRAEYGLNELGGFTVHVGGKVIIPVQVAEKGVCWFKIKKEGVPGHGSVPFGDNPVVAISRAIDRLNNTLPPLHLTDEVLAFMETVKRCLPKAQAKMIDLLMKPSTHSLMRKLAFQYMIRSLIAMTHNTMNPTGFQAGKSFNVVPAEAECQVDGRLIPGQNLDSFLNEVTRIIGRGYKYEVAHYAPPTQISYPTPLYDTIVRTLQELEPEALVTPYMITGFTDAKYYADLGIKTYGFSPVKMPPEIYFHSLYHADNERIPVDGFYWGLRVFFEVVRRFVT